MSRYILWGDSYDILFQIPLTFVQLVEIDSDKLPTVQDFFPHSTSGIINAWRRLDNKPLPEPMAT